MFRLTVDPSSVIGEWCRASGETSAGTSTTAVGEIYRYSLHATGDGRSEVLYVDTTEGLRTLWGTEENPLRVRPIG